MIKIDEQIAVPAPSARVWDVISRPSEVVSCIKGAELGEQYEDGTFDGTLVVKFSALRVRFGARVSLDLDEPELVGRLSARGRDGQGATRFNGHATFAITEDAVAGGSRVHMVGEVNLAGKLASLIEAGAGAVVSRMTKDFTDELVRRCADIPAAVVAAENPSAPSRPSLWRRIRTWWRRTARNVTYGKSGVARGTAE